MSDAFARSAFCLLGLPFDAVDMEEAKRRVRDAARQRRALVLATPNLNFAVACLEDAAFRACVLESDLSVVDGMPLVWVARLLDAPIRERVPGSALFEQLRADGGATLRVYFFGGPAGVAEAACRRLNADSSSLVCVGHRYPGHDSVEAMSTDEIISEINASGADLLVVALGARKGHAWIARNRRRLRVPVVSHLGAVVNFVAGTVARAPDWMQHLGLEWLWRIKEEPGLWRRYFGDGLVFLRLLATRVLPYAWYLARHRPRPADLDAARAELRIAPGSAWVRVSGAWGASNLGALREHLTQALLAEGEIHVDLREVTYAGTALIGLMMLLLGEAARQRKRVIFEDAGPGVRRAFRYACAEHLLRAD